MVKYGNKYKGGNKEECENKPRCCPCLDEEVDRIKQAEEGMSIMDEVFKPPKQKEENVTEEEKNKREEDAVAGILEASAEAKRRKPMDSSVGSAINAPVPRRK